MNDVDQLVPVVKVEPRGMGSPLVIRIDDKNGWRLLAEEMECLLGEGEDGDVVTVTRERMTAGDLMALGEHTGW